VTININAAGNDRPEATNDYDTTEEDTPVTVVVLSNDSDLDSDPLTTTGIVSGSGPSNGAATLNADGTIEYTPNADFTGQDSFVYIISDGKGGADTATGEYHFLGWSGGECVGCCSIGCRKSCCCLL